MYVGRKNDFLRASQLLIQNAISVVMSTTHSTLAHLDLLFNIDFVFKDRGDKTLLVHTGMHWGAGKTTFVRMIPQKTQEYREELIYDCQCPVEYVDGMLLFMLHE